MVICKGYTIKTTQLIIIGLWHITVGDAVRKNHSYFADI